MYLVIFQKSDSRLSFYFPQVSQNLIPMLLLIPLLSLLINKGPHVTRILPIRVSLISLYLLGVWESGSRISGLLSLTSISIFFLVYSFFVNEKKKTFNLFLIPFLFFSVFLAGILFSYSKAFQANWSEFFQRDQNVQGLQTLSGRTVVWQHSFEYIRENWLIGGGYYSGHRYALGSVSDLVRVHNNLDNTWLELQVNLGIFGVIAGFALIVHGLICSTWTRDYETITFLAFWTATFGVSFFNPTFQSVGITQVIFFYLLFCRDSIEVNRTFQDKSSQKIKTIPSLKRVN
jgi:O-antigen ligase